MCMTLFALVSQLPLLSNSWQGTTGFLPAAAFPERPLIPGALLDVVVTSKKAGGRITVDAGSEAVAAAKTEEWIGMHIGEAAAGGVVHSGVGCGDREVCRGPLMQCTPEGPCRHPSQSLPCPLQAPCSPAHWWPPQ